MTVMLKPKLQKSTISSLSSWALSSFLLADSCLASRAYPETMPKMRWVHFLASPVLAGEQRWLEGISPRCVTWEMCVGGLLGALRKHDGSGLVQVRNITPLFRSAKDA